MLRLLFLVDHDEMLAGRKGLSEMPLMDGLMMRRQASEPWAMAGWRRREVHARYQDTTMLLGHIDQYAH
jgi:hypothetical protein